MTDSPSMHELIVLRDRNDREFRTRVEGLDDGLIVVARPRDLPAEHDFDLGSSVRIAWHRPNGISVLPGSLTEANQENTVGLWTITLSGSGWREQRRAFVRVPAEGPVKMSWQAVRPDETVATPLEIKAQLSDVSEAGLRFTMNTRPLPGLDHSDVRVTVDFDVDSNPFRLTGSVLHIRPHAKLSAVLEVVVLFAQHGRQADQLRKLVYARQLQERDAA